MRLEVRNGCFRREKNIILNNINLTSEDGDVTAILGVNGIGKSTLVKCICGLLPWTSGETLIDGKNIDTLSVRGLWSIIGYVPQGTSQTPLSAFETVLLGRTAGHGLFSQPNDEDCEKALEAMKVLGIEELKSRPCNALSGGERRLVTIARALAAGPRLLLMDEPEASLDIKNSSRIISLVRQLAGDGQLQIIFCTHNPQHALDAANKVLIFDGSGNAHWGDTSDMLTEKVLRKAYGVDIRLVESEGRALVVLGEEI